MGVVVLEWSEAVPTNGTVELTPDANALDGLGRNHSLETAIADLVDNSVDARATHVLVRFVKRSGRLDSLCVLDNGTGIAMVDIDDAMTIGRTRKDSQRSLGRFGIGLKGASFSQASSLSLMTQTATGETSGRRWSRASVSDSFECEIVDDRFVDGEFRRDWGIPLNSGTIVRWDSVHTFPASSESDLVEEYLTKSTTALAAHLGLVFHRMLDRKAIVIVIDTWDASLKQPGPPVPVGSLNPFGYPIAGKLGYPANLTASDGRVELSLRCHIWPGRSTLQQFKLLNGPMAHQGLYFYRGDRLLQAGGWDGIRTVDRRLQLARVEIDITDDLQGLFRMNPEKSRVHITQDFARLVEKAQSEDSDIDLNGYLTEAEEVFRVSRKKSFKRRAMLPPGRGFAKQVKATIEDEVPLRSDEKPIDVRWVTLVDDSFIEFDHEERCIKLNSRYRQAVLGNRNGSLNDVPIVKALLYLLGEEVFGGDYLGPRDKDNIDLWTDVLTAAAKSERR